MKFIQVNNGKLFAMVDDFDFDRVSAYKWFVSAKRTYPFSKKWVNGKRITFSMHRFILELPKNSFFVDHIDRNPLNNLRSNLRLCNSSQNQANKLRKTKKTSGNFKGVYFRKNKNAFVSEITCMRKRHYLGLFRSEIDAARAYNDMAIKLFGEFALLNLIPEEKLLAS